MMTLQGPPSSSCRSNNLKKVKQEGETHLKGIKLGFATPLYAPVPTLGDSGSISKKELVKKYEFCCEGLKPKCVKVPRDIYLEDIIKIFGLVVNNNGYNYEFTKDLEFIEKVKKLWMVVHQKPYLPTLRLISLGMTRGLTYEKMAKKMNWAMFVNAPIMNSNATRQGRSKWIYLALTKKSMMGPIWRRWVANRLNA